MTPVDTALTATTSLAVPVAALLLVVSVLWPRAARRVDLAAVVLALVGAIAARLAVTDTSAGDTVFRGATAPWALALSVAAAGWWFVHSPGRPVRSAAAVRVGLGAVAVAVAVGAGATALGHPPAWPGA